MLIMYNVTSYEQSDSPREFDTLRGLVCDFITGGKSLKCKLEEDILMRYKRRVLGSVFH
jgi:hypothetical protein